MRWKHLKIKNKRTPVALKLKRELFKKDNFYCEYKELLTQTKSNSTFQLQIDHKIPIAKGGTNEVCNLRVICAAHNRIEAMKWSYEVGTKK